MTKTCVTLLAISVGIGSGILSAQSPPESLPQFEVASIKPNKSGDFRRSIGPAPGGFSALNVTLRELIPMAYGIPQAFGEISIVGGPKWMDDERFDIDAKTDGRQPAARIGQMLRALLIDRFRLKAHKETREVPVYALVMADADRRFGPRLAPASYDCAVRRAALARGATPPPLPSPGPDGRNMCSGQSRPGNIWSKGFDIDSLTSSLAPFVGRVVRNHTGLTGGFDYDVEWTPESPQRPDRPEPAIDPNGPSIFTALREQLGLKLDSQRGPVDVVVIDSAEYPTPN
jgi:uncharacterized protein (TIGR03435 family)